MTSCLVGRFVRIKPNPLLVCFIEFGLLRTQITPPPPLAPFSPPEERSTRKGSRDRKKERKKERKKRKGRERSKRRG
jgi:hypothetical protein